MILRQRIQCRIDLHNDAPSAVQPGADAVPCHRPPLLGFLAEHQQPNLDDDDAHHAHHTRQMLLQNLVGPVHQRLHALLLHLKTRHPHECHAGQHPQRLQPTHIAG